MKTLKDISYDLVRSQRRTADIIIEPDGKVVVRAPEDVPEEKIEDIVEAKRLWIYKNLAEWRDLNATRVLREYRNGEGFLYLGRSYRLLLVSDQTEPVLLKGGGSGCAGIWWKKPECRRPSRLLSAILSNAANSGYPGEWPTLPPRRAWCLPAAP
jgi:hypothetical protein